METSTIERMLIESIGWDNWKFQSATREKQGDEINVAQQVGKYDNEEVSSMIASFFNESVLHARGGIEKNGLVNEINYVDFGNDPQESVEKKVYQWVYGAQQVGLLHNRAEKYTTFCRGSRHIFKPLLRSDAPGKYPQIELIWSNLRR